MAARPLSSIRSRGSFAADVTAFVKKTGLRVELVVKKLAFDAFAGVVRRTPVDTGRARANWRIAVNTTDTTVTGTPASKPDKDSGPSPDDLAKLAVLEGVKLGDRVVISNNLPYIGPLENGHSSQAPSGMLRVTFEDIKAGFAATVASVKEETP